MALHILPHWWQGSDWVVDLCGVGREQEGTLPHRGTVGLGSKWTGCWRMVFWLELQRYATNVSYLTKHDRSHDTCSKNSNKCDKSWEKMVKFSTYSAHHMKKKHGKNNKTALQISIYQLVLHPPTCQGNRTSGLFMPLGFKKNYKFKKGSLTIWYIVWWPEAWLNVWGTTSPSAFWLVQKNRKQKVEKFPRFDVLGGASSLTSSSSFTSCTKSRCCFSENS